MPKVSLSIKVNVGKEEFLENCSRALHSMPNNFNIKQTETGFEVKEAKTDLLNGTYAAMVNVSYLNGEVSIDGKCAGIGPIQNKHVTEVTTIIKNTIERSIQEKDSP